MSSSWNPAGMPSYDHLPAVELGVLVRYLSRRRRPAGDSSDDHGPSRVDGSAVIRFRSASPPDAPATAAATTGRGDEE